MRKTTNPFDSPLLSTKDKRFLELAKRVALRSTFRRKQVGVILVKTNSIVASAWNKASHPLYKSLPGFDKYAYWSLHAEAAAILSVDNVRKTTAYIFGFKYGRFGNAAPCPLCYKHLKERGVYRVVHTTPFGDIKEIKWATS